ncbi:MAG: 3-deoxy-7-phosphoheptulonate synthase [Chlamydiales bacterium]
MGYTTKLLPSPNQLKETYFLSHTQTAFIESSRNQTKRILFGTDPRLLAIIGPCSIHDPLAAIEYAKKLRKLSQEVQDTFFVIMRVYFEKPRSGVAWKGLLHDPTLSGTEDLHLGLLITRKLLIDITQLGVPIASELLDPNCIPYIDDVLTWASIGARTPESQIHRQIASGIDIPVGFKNSTDGSYDAAIQAIRVSLECHAYIGLNQEGNVASINTSGNPQAHIVLRGGNHIRNYDKNSVEEVMRALEMEELPLRCVIDCSHGNSQKDPHQQVLVLNDLVRQTCEGSPFIRGFMLESFLKGGRDDEPKHFGVSITDPCLDWETTRELILNARDTLQRLKVLSH